MDGLVSTMDCCKAVGVSTDRAISVVPFTPPSKSAPYDSVREVCFDENFPDNHMDCLSYSHAVC